jgi:hypothetical protein
MAKLYQEIASTLQAIRNCRAANNREWLDKHGETLKELAGRLPHGSGIDNGVTIDEDACEEHRLVFYFGFHHMNETGMYDGWTYHTLYVYPEFDGIRLRITGKDRNDVKEYLYDLFHDALNEEVRRHIYIS